MKTLFTFKLPTKSIEILADDVKSAFLKLGKKAKTQFTSVHCDDTGESLSDGDVFGMFGHDVAL